MSKKLWGGRFKKDLDPIAKLASYSLTVDQVLFTYDIEVSLAHVKTLVKQHVITAKEGKRLETGLKSVLKQFSEKDLNQYATQFEDVHTFIQLQLEKKVGPIAKAIHTGRSRNDLVITATFLYLKDRVEDIVELLMEFQTALVAMADRTQNVFIPGYTHLQRAQVISMAHHLLAYVEMFERDKSRLQSAYDRFNYLPLGSAALAGSSFPLDRKFLAQQLNFKNISANSLDAVSDRDALIEVLSHLSVMWMHLSRLSEDFILWNSQEFGFIELSDAWSTGSSLMPNKKNPDLLELTRGRSGRIFGALQSLLVTMKGLPLSYNRDMQEDKAVLVESIQQSVVSLLALTGLVNEVSIKEDNCRRAAADSFLYATDVLDYLVRKGRVFRKAHETVGEMVAYCQQHGLDLADLPLSDFQSFALEIKDDIYDLFNPKASVSAKKSYGSPAPQNVKLAIATWKKRLRNQRARI